MEAAVVPKAGAEEAKVARVHQKALPAGQQRPMMAINQAVDETTPNSTE